MFAAKKKKKKRERLIIQARKINNTQENFMTAKNN